MPADERFVTRPYQPGDETAILELFAASFHRSRSMAHFHWKYLQNPYGNQHISLTFDGDGHLVGHYSGYVVPFVDAGRDLVAHQIGDTMTAQNVRHVGRGPTSILGRTALHFYETFCAGKVAFNYGFNVANIQKFSLRFLRSDRVEPILYWRRAMPIAPVTRLHRWPRGYQLELMTDAGTEFDRFFERMAPWYGLMVRRDAQYIRWRYLQCPEPGFFLVVIRKWRRLVGWSVFRVRDGRLTWGDALFDPRHPEAVEVLIRHVAPAYPVEQVEAWFPRRMGWLVEALGRLGFNAGKEPQDLSLMCVPFGMPQATARMREALYSAMGDSDLF